METVRVETVKDTINAININVENLENSKTRVIQENAPAINELIQKKVKALSESIKEESIREICGAELDAIDVKIKAEKDKAELLASLIEVEEDVVEDTSEDAETTPETEETETANTSEVEEEQPAEVLENKEI